MKAKEIDEVTQPPEVQCQVQARLRASLRSEDHQDLQIRKSASLDSPHNPTLLTCKPGMKLTIIAIARRVVLQAHMQYHRLALMLSDASIQKRVLNGRPARQNDDRRGSFDTRQAA